MLPGFAQFFEQEQAAPAWQNPYVTDGLIAMWDGEWNAGGGVHDAAATTWVDLSGNGHNLTMPASSAFEIDSNAVKFNGRGQAVGISSAALLAVFDGTLEIVAKRSLSVSSSSTREILACGPAAYWRGLGTTQGGPIGTTAYSDAYAGYRMYCIPSVETVEAPIAVAFAYDRTSNEPVRACYANGVQATRSYIYNWKEAAPSSAQPRIGTTSTFDGDTAVFCVRAYSRNLTAAEVAANYAVDAERFNLS